MTAYGGHRTGFAARRAHRPPPPVGPVARRKAWLPVTAAALASAADPGCERAAAALAHALKGLSADSFPLEPGDARGGAVKAFVELARFWCAVSGASRTPFAGALKGLAQPLDWLLHELGAEIAQAGLAARGLGD